MSLYVGAAGESPSPERASCTSSPRSAMHASMSTSTCREKSGTVALDSAIRRAIVCWVRVSSTVVVAPLAVVTAASPAARGAARRDRCGGRDGRVPWLAGSAWRAALNVAAHDAAAGSGALDGAQVDA